ncbi:MAG: hypothetical protein K1X47_05720 [Cyclobacteriaceae bacterium]|nr:hypothetical protein [Cyclobacteriaceae bacterium]
MAMSIVVFKHRWIRWTPFIILFMVCIKGQSQDLYTARGYWQEIHKETYQRIVQKGIKGDSLTSEEKSYFSDYQQYLGTYYQRMPETERQRFEQMKDQWDRDAAPVPAVTNDKPEEYQWRTRDRLRNGAYGFYYGLSMAAITNSSGGGYVGLPLIAAGVWQLGPAVFPKKYENMTYATLRAGNSGKMLGLLYGGALAMAVGPSDESSGKLILGLSSLGSIALGEIAFQRQRSKPVSEGQIELMRHYGTMGPGVALLGLMATSADDINLAGGVLLGGGITGLLLAPKVAKRNNFTPGDVDVISSFTWISTGLGFTLASAAIDDGSDNKELLLIPAAAAIAGTIIEQKAVKGLQLTPRQGSTINLASGGAALVGLGIIASIDPEKSTAYFGVPSALALITHQIILHKYKVNQQEKKLGARHDKFTPKFSMQVTPENWLLNKQLGEKLMFVGNRPSAQPVVSLRLTF